MPCLFSQTWIRNIAYYIISKIFWVLLVQPTYHTIHICDYTTAIFQRINPTCDCIIVENYLVFSSKIKIRCGMNNSSDYRPFHIGIWMRSNLTLNDLHAFILY
uniref:Uncharacterized protein n=1 Tax=uncultured marine thaumarchaeote KM3_66_E06 TaxID=1456228 RepID=A0A075HIB8_9ARCH|nr:hypothetical protein [uncultured marine thaumarchaeote KM3_66_E06]